MSFDDSLGMDGHLAVADTNGSDKESGAAKVLALSVFGAATGYVIYRVGFAKRDPKKPEDTTSEQSPVILTSKKLHRERINTLRSQKIHLHQFQYAWGPQAHLRMANANFDEHNIRHVNSPEPQCLFPLLVGCFSRLFVVGEFYLFFLSFFTLCWCSFIWSPVVRRTCFVFSCSDTLGFPGLTLRNNVFLCHN